MAPNDMGHQERILIVDDDPNIARLIELYLKRQGYQITIAGSGIQALTLCDRQDFDLAIMDAMMPGMDGFDVCRALRERERTANLPIIMLSALNQVQDKIKGLRAGSDEYVTKPVDLEELGVRVAVLLERTRRLMQARPAASGKVLAFLGAKGGVGTTTLALNVASALVQLKKQVLAVELHPGYGGFAFQFKAKPRAGLAQLTQLEPNQVSERQIRSCLQPCAAGFQVLFGPQEPEDYRAVPAATAEAIVRHAAGMADYTVVDLPTSPDEAVQAVVRASNLVGIVLEGEPASMNAARAVADLLRSWGLSGGAIVAVSVNRSGLATGFSLRDIRSQLGCEVLGMVPRASEALQTALDRGSTLVALKMEHLATSACADMANRLLVEPVVGIRI